MNDRSDGAFVKRAATNGEIVAAAGSQDHGTMTRLEPHAGAPSRRKGQWLAFLAFGALTFGAAAIGAPVSKRKPWYRSLRKSSATPPDWVFGPVWTALDTAIAYSGFRTWRAPDSPDRTRALRLWGLQMALNASWSPLFFGAHRPKESAVVTAALVPTIAAYIRTARKVDPPAGYLMVPYLAWSGFATFLNVQILRKNAWRFR
jgi:benzodiazapine receptor